MRKERHAGFTLVELLVVLAIVAAMITISVPAVAALTSPKETLRKEGRRLIRLMNEARQEAMNRKIQIEIRIDPLRNEVRAVESNAYRMLMANYPDGLVDRADEAWEAGMSNRYERVIAFNEDIIPEGFPVEEIEAPFDEDELFQHREAPLRNDDPAVDPEAETVALTFTHFGGSDGGGVSLYYKDTRLDIAADILTGRPKPVDRMGLEQ